MWQRALRAEQKRSPRLTLKGLVSASSTAWGSAQVQREDDPEGERVEGCLDTPARAVAPLKAYYCS